MQLGMIGLGRMGANMVRRLLRKGHEGTVFDTSPKAVADLVREQAVSCFAGGFRASSSHRAIWLMVHRPSWTDHRRRLPNLDRGSHHGGTRYVDDIRRERAGQRIHYVDVGTSSIGAWSAVTA
jgi:6-phosphogluconate dehydrogenase